MGMLDSYKKQREKEARQKKNMEKILTCPNCGELLLGDTFMNGGKIAGKMYCLTKGCKTRIIF